MKLFAMTMGLSALLAAQIVEMAELPSRLHLIKQQLDIALDEAQRAEFSEELLTAAEALFGAARALRSSVRALEEDE